MLRRLRFRLEHRLLKPWLSHPPGHFCSPLGDPDELDARRDELWPARGEAPAFDLQAQGQRALLREVMPALLQAFDYPVEPAEAHRFHLGNSQFPHADARALFALLRHWRPRRLVEVGSGFSTLLSADVNLRFLDGGMRIVAVEPNPRPFLRDLPGLAELRVERVQDTPP